MGSFPLIIAKRICFGREDKSMTLVSDGSTEQTSQVGNHSKHNMKEKKKSREEKLGKKWHIIFRHGSFK